MMGGEPMPQVMKTKELAEYLKLHEITVWPRGRSQPSGLIESGDSIKKVDKRGQKK
jgi:hypothetical protein